MIKNESFSPLKDRNGEPDPFTKECILQKRYKGSHHEGNKEMHVESISWTSEFPKKHEKYHTRKQKALNITLSHKI